jgi:hypothetical protein
VRCSETRCPFCAALLAGCLGFAPFRLHTRLDRLALRAVGAALTTAGIAVSCTSNVQPPYGYAGGGPALGGSGGNGSGGLFIGLGGDGGAAGDSATNEPSGGRSEGGGGGDQGGEP